MRNISKIAGSRWLFGLTTGAASAVQPRLLNVLFDAVLDRGLYSPLPTLPGEAQSPIKHFQEDTGLPEALER